MSADCLGCIKMLSIYSNTNLVAQSFLFYICSHRLSFWHFPFDFMLITWAVVAVIVNRNYSAILARNYSDILAILEITSYVHRLRISQAPKTPTSILFTPIECFAAFGYEAEERYAALSQQGRHKDWYFFKRFKLTLYNNKVGYQLSINWKQESHTVAIENLAIIKTWHLIVHLRQWEVDLMSFIHIKRCC